MPLSLFKKPAPTNPHAERLAEFYRQYNTLQETSSASQRAIEATTARRRRVDEYERRLHEVSDAVIAARADVEMGVGSPDQVEHLERQRSTLETEIKPIREDARVAERVEAKLMKDREILQADMAALLPKWQPLVFPILQERGAALASEYTEKLNAFLDVAVRAFGIARAADEMAKAVKSGEFAQAWNLRDLKPLLGVYPRFAGFGPISRDIDAEAASEAEAIQRDLSR